MAEGKLLRISIALIITAFPFFVWLILYISNPRSQEELRTQIARLNRLRWISLIAGLAIFLICALNQPSGSLWNFGTNVLLAGPTLLLPDSWLKKRLARSGQTEMPPPKAITHTF